MVHGLAHKLHIALKKIVYIRLCLYIIQVHEQFANHHKLLVNIHYLVETFLQSTVFVIPILTMVLVVRIGIANALELTFIL